MALFASEGSSIIEEKSLGERGKFKFLYERHGVGITPEDISPDTDIFFREISLPYLSRLEPERLKELLFGEVAAYSFGHLRCRFLSDPVLIKISEIKAEIMFGDILMPDFAQFATLSLLSLEYFFGLSRVLPISPIGKFLSRRKFLKEVSLFFSFWALSPAATRGLSLLAGLESRQTPFKCLAARLEGIQSHFHPELLVNYLRNLFMADKLLLVAYDLMKIKGSPPLITVNTELGHAGIEDLISLGQDWCRFLIASLPRSLLDEIIRVNGTIRDVCAARFIRFEKEITPSDLADPQRLLQIKFSDRCLVDEDLIAMIEKQKGR
jgi:hypothetical protein